MATSHYDDIVTTIGEFGPYQKKVYFVYCLPAAMKAAVVMGSVFILTLPEYRCKLPDYPNDTYAIQNDFHRHLVNVSIPRVVRNQEESYSHCSLHVNNTSTVTSASLATQTDCDAWVYESSEFSSSIMTEYDLVCSRRAMRSHINMGFFALSMVGSLLFGLLADIFGRKVSLLLCMMLQSVCGISIYFVYSLYAVIAIRSIQGMTNTMFAISATAGMELVGPSKRTFAGIIVEIFWSGGQYLLVLVAFLTKDWRLLQLIFGVVSLAITAAICFAPESPRWLMEKMKYEKAEKIFKVIAQSNKQTWSEDLLARQVKDKPEISMVSLLRWLKNKTVFKRSTIVFFNWFAVNFLYYGLVFNVDNLFGSLYTNFLLSASAECIAFFLSWIALNYVGRKTCYILTMISGAAACILVVFPTIYGSEEHRWIIILLATLGRLSSGAAYTILYIMTIELFPTTARNSVLGLCSVFENSGGVIAPYIADLGVIVGGTLAEALSLSIFGVVTLMAALLAICLPETKDQPLPETFADVDEGYKDNKNRQELCTGTQTKF